MVEKNGGTDEIALTGVTSNAGSLRAWSYSNCSDGSTAGQTTGDLQDKAIQSKGTKERSHPKH